MISRPGPPRTVGPILDALRAGGVLVRAPEDPFAISGICADSRTLEPGGLFCAVRGTTTDGHAYVGAAVGRGASGIVAEHEVDVSVPVILVTDGQRAARLAAEAWYGRPGDRLRLIGVTGTNGKTTTVALIRHLLNGTATAGSLGTLGAIDGNGERVPSTAGVLTTPGPVDLQATLAEFVRRGVSDVAMEASSHSLHQRRLDGLSLAAAVFTNLSRDHLDYHPSMAEYLGAKLTLGSYLGLGGVAIVNADDDAWAALKPGTRRVSFGMQPGADLRVEVERATMAGSRFRVAGPFGSAWVELPLLGAFNVSNALAAAATVLALGESLDRVATRLSEAPAIPGRMEVISRRPCLVIRDYAHTPDALARALEALRPLTHGRLVALFGCGGDRDRGKRPLMGQVAATLADESVVTSDNPRTENPGHIIDEIERGMGTAPRRRIVDRREAILTALGTVSPADILLLAGKGHETYQVLGHERVPFDEKTIVEGAVGGL